MSRLTSLLVCAGLLAALPATAAAKGPLPEPDDGPDPRGMTLSGTAAASVRAPAQRTEEAIERAVQAARPVAVARALRDARERAVALAAAAGLTLGPAVAVSERDRELEQGFVPARRWCFRSRRTRRTTCRVPESTTATVAVTFATAQTDAALPDGRAITAPGTAGAPVRPRDRASSPSIESAVRAARTAAAPLALAAARRAAATLAASAALPLGALFSIAEVRRPYEDFTLGTFDVGRYCGIVSRSVVAARPPDGPAARRAPRAPASVSFPSRVNAGFRVTYLPAASAA